MTLEALLPYWPVVAATILLTSAGLAYYLWLKRRPNAAELERRRREQIERTGKMGDATITEVQQGLVCYSYHVRGIEYQATQDVSSLEAHLPADDWEIIGSAGVKYDPRNPANSIILSEKWSGLRKNSNQKTKT